MNETHEWQGGLHAATDTGTVIEVIMRAVHLIPGTEPRSPMTGFTPSRLDSREDVEHWGRRLDHGSAAREPGHLAMRQLFAAALSRLDEIGPRRHHGAPRPRPLTPDAS